MGGYWLEISKMGIYLAFPVAMFHYFNQPEYFEKWVTQTKRELFPPDSKSNAKELDELKQTIRTRRNEQLMKQLDERDVNASKSV